MVMEKVVRKRKETKKAALWDFKVVVKQRAERDGTVLEEYWLGDDDLEPDPGGPLPIEQPTGITTKPLSTTNQGDWIRMAFDLTSNDPLPDANYLRANLKMPSRIGS